MSHKGSCICGQVSFIVDGDLNPAIACHCQQCRKGSGHYVVATAASRDAISVAGEVRWYAYKPGILRGFCATCGSQLFWNNEKDNTLSIMMAALDTPTGLTIEGHIYTDEKGDYYDIPPELPSAPADDPLLTTRR